MVDYKQAGAKRLNPLLLRTSSCVSDVSPQRSIERLLSSEIWTNWTISANYAQGLLFEASLRRCTWVPVSRRGLIEFIASATLDGRAGGVRHYSNFIINQLNIADNTPGAPSFVGRIASKAGLSGKTERKSIEVLLHVKDNLILIGKKPVPLAAAALYLASTFTGEHTTLLKIASAAEVTPITVRKRSLEISQILAAPLRTSSSFTMASPSELFVELILRFLTHRNLAQDRH